MKITQRLKNLWMLSEYGELILPEVMIKRKDVEEIMKPRKMAQIINMDNPVDKFIKEDGE